MNGDSNLIKLEVEGVSSEKGHVRFDEFLQKLEDLLIALNGIDRIVGNTFQPTLYYRVVDVKHDSPVFLILEPVIREAAAVPPQRAQEYIKARHDRFFGELDAIRKNEPISPELGEHLLQRLEDLVEGRGRSFERATISNSETKIELDIAFETNLRRLLAEEDSSYGGVEGTLDAVNIHGATPRFWIYPRLGADRIKCDFLPGTAEQIREALGKHVRVEGVKYFRSSSPFPYRIAVRQFEIMDGDESTALFNLRGIAPRATGELSSVEFVRAIRDEWD
jgi:hypothetical protein